MSKIFTVALIGPDGAGKSTIGHKLELVSPLPIKYMYMGVNLESSNMVLPTTRLLLEFKRAQGQRPDIATRPRDSYQSRARSKSLLKRLAAGLRAALRFVNLTAEEWFRQIVVWSYTLRGYYVVFDRHFYFDYYAHDVVNDGSKRPLNSRIHGFMLKNLYPKPDFVIFLDAPSEVLFARKPEGTLEALERRRQEYVQLQEVIESWAVVDVSQPVDEVVQQVSDLIVKFHNSKDRVKKVNQWTD
jgi:thymidylate kinase